MSDWIKDLKQKEEDDQAAALRNEKAKLRRYHLIQDQAPIMWRSIIGQVKSDVAELAQHFPHDGAKHLKAIEEGDSLVLVRVTPGHIYLQARWVEDGLLVGIELKQADIDSEKVVSRHEIMFTVADDSDKVFMSIGGRSNAKAISEYLIKMILS